MNKRMIQDLRDKLIHLLDQLLADEDIEDYCSENCYDRDDD
ncbi:hypothetical protein SEA_QUALLIFICATION_97 [Mycobacterium phage Quallification]|uniref:Uncharacterized protein n=8 Tax=Kostyavirus TaxID=1623284 RepID=G1DI30_9CAUD|nr:hypothetical protein Kostya_96 [Mycobacterium phage Kostya]YP_008051575.1 hypothetical protein PBI_MURPHY_96 [Mycobacterium phage Murphy]YP_008409489.1 hypothetical protein DRDREY_96 [Mycobacterium phage DrDrey]YP_008430611.1 hypothetical protein GOKU_95 [Mycobacterium phage Goku]YP_009197762.1 hypothetical protein SEA_NELITZAMV_94 [Mycobacterium phage NelitzaMV]YP_009208502.1 hypothetical protein SEA_TOTO_94 [Mycobacterium phage Toto]YP_009224361.1 hypothetical protein SEA_DUSK_93 [Mycoba